MLYSASRMRGTDPGSRSPPEEVGGPGGLGLVLLKPVLRLDKGRQKPGCSPIAA